MKIETLYLLFTYNRPTILAECWRSLFEKNKFRPDRIIIVDDGSHQSVKHGLFNAQIGTNDVPIDLLSLGKNVGYGTAAEIGFKLVEGYNPKYLFFLEADYIFGTSGIDRVMDVFKNNEFGQQAAGFSGYDNPDFYVKEKTDQTFPRIIVEDCGEDNLNRSIMYKPFKQTTAFGEIDLEFVSNSCGTMYLNWEMIQKIRKDFPEDYQFWLDKITDKHKEKRLLNDGMMSHGLSWLWNKYALKHGIDRNKYAALLNIKPSVSNHINGGGINGHIVGECTTFVGSPTWKND